MMKSLRTVPAESVARIEEGQVLPFDVLLQSHFFVLDPCEGKDNCILVKARTICFIWFNFFNVANALEDVQNIVDNAFGKS